MIVERNRLWDLNYQGGDDDLQECIKKADEEFERNPAPYRVEVLRMYKRIINGLPDGYPMPLANRK